MRAVVSKWSMILGLALFLSGLMAALGTCISLNAKLSEIQRSRHLLARVTDLERKLASVDEAKLRLAKLDSAVPGDLDSIIRDSGLQNAVTDARSAVSSLDDGWSVLTREIAFSDLVLADLDAFVVSCHQARPPWTVSEISLKSSPFESGRAQATLTLQALRRKSQ